MSLDSACTAIGSASAFRPLQSCSLSWMLFLFCSIAVLFCVSFVQRGEKLHVFFWMLLTPLLSHFDNWTVRHRFSLCCFKGWVMCWCVCVSVRALLSLSFGASRRVNYSRGSPGNSLAICITVLEAYAFWPRNPILSNRLGIKSVQTCQQWDAYFILVYNEKLLEAMPISNNRCSLHESWYIISINILQLLEMM